jgi:3-hydroxyisobutyrate dehydrogenase-like beta-hydroxyacid dehydrogenase
VTDAVIGLVHPGSMGAAVAACLTSSGRVVAWASAGRSESTRARAKAAGLTDLGTLDRLRDECAIVLSICPPHGALDVADELSGYAGLYVDANGISPQLSNEVESAITSSGARFVDGGIVGPAPHSAGTTRLYLSGAEAADVAALFEGTLVDARVLESSEAGAASSLKMAYSAWTKITSALQLAIRSSAKTAGVEAALLAEWAMSQPGLAGKSERSASVGLERGWRWAFEMDEIARTFAADGLPAGFGTAAAEVYARLPRPAEATEGQPLAAGHGLSDLDRALRLLRPPA